MSKLCSTLFLDARAALCLLATATHTHAHAHTHTHTYLDKRVEVDEEEKRHEQLTVKAVCHSAVTRNQIVKVLQMREEESVCL